MDATALEDLLVDGTSIDADVAEACTDARVEESATEITQLEFTLSDPGFEILASRIFAKGAKVKYSGLDLVVDVVETGGTDVEQLTITARSRGARKLQEERGTAPGASEDSSDYTTYLSHAAARSGLTFHGQPALQSSFLINRIAEPGHLESTWDVGQRGAQEWGFWLFEAGGVLFFGKPSWLLGSTPKAITVGWDDSAGVERNSIEIPRCRHSNVTTSTGQAEANTVEVSIDVATAAGIRPGMVLAFSGVAGFEGRYLVTQNIWLPGTSDPAQVTATSPIDPYIDPASIVDTSIDPDTLLPPVAGYSDGGQTGPSQITTKTLLAQAKAAVTRWPFILEVERAFRLPAYLLLAVGSKETNLSVAYTQGSVGDHGHGHGVWQLDNRSHTIPAGFDTDPVAQANKAAAMLRSNLDRYGELVSALNVYNSGQTKSANTTANYGPDVAARRQLLEVNAKAFLP